MLTLENVVPLATPGKNQQFSNLDFVVNLLADIGICAVVWRLDPKDWGVPVNRPRLWISGIPFRVLDELGCDHERFREDMLQVMNDVVGLKMSPLEDYLLPDKSSALQDYFRDCRMNAAMDAGNMLDAVVAGAGLFVPPNKRGRRGARSVEPGVGRFHASELQAFPGLHAISDRQVQLLELSGIREFPESLCRCLDLKHSVARLSKPTSIASCILPGGQQYLTSKCRFMHPLESLGLQGICVPSEVSSRFSLPFMQDLAGNAFEASCCLSVIFVTLTVLARHSCPPPAPQASLSVAPCAEEESDSDSEYFRVPRRRGRLC
jgi:hypothetical protein